LYFSPVEVFWGLCCCAPSAPGIRRRSGKPLTLRGREKPVQDVLFEYEMHPTTWAYLSSLLIVGIYFKFYRFWSVRNLDLIGLIFFAPGLLLLSHGKEQWGYAWLFVVGGFLLIRLLLDAVMVRRPLLEPNLSPSGLTFTGVALLVFLVTNVMTGHVVRTRSIHARAVEAPAAGRPAVERPDGEDPGAATEDGDVGGSPQPAAGYPPFYQFAGSHTGLFDPRGTNAGMQGTANLLGTAATRLTVVAALLLLAVGMVLIGYRHFDNIHTGVAMASLFLLLPYTSQMADRVDHMVPGALLVWAMAAYRLPGLAGLFFGLVGGLVYYPLFLLPLWCSFYWRRGLFRFLLGTAAALGVLAALLVLSPAELGTYGEQVRRMFGVVNPLKTSLVGFWAYHEEAFRIPVLAAFVALCASLVLWPAEKNLGTLLSCSAAVMLGAQFWIAQCGGLYMAWYLPLLILTSFRPNLEDRLASTAVSPPWYPRLPRLAVRKLKRRASAHP
jgi:hypothetical protein